MDWLLASIDPSRGHEIGVALSWHARLMTLGWGVLAPLAVVIARFFKIWPGQDWPRELDSPVWWRSHWIGHSLVVCLTLAALMLVLPVERAKMGWHNWLGFAVLACMAVQVLLGVTLCHAGTGRGDHHRGAVEGQRARVDVAEHRSVVGRADRGLCAVATARDGGRHLSGDLGR